METILEALMGVRRHGAPRKTTKPDNGIFGGKKYGRYIEADTKMASG